MVRYAVAGGKKVLILGGGAGGVVAANILASKLRGEAEITLVDKSSYHVFQPSQPWVMMGQREPDDIRRPLRLLERKGVRVLVEEVESIKPEEHSVQTSSRRLDYDYLVVALGSIPEPEKIPGDTRRVCTPWTLEGALECRKLLAGFKGGSVVVTPVSWPYKCPPAPFEVAFMVKYLAEQRGVNADITVAHFWKEPMDPFGSMLVNAFKKFLDQYGVGYAGGVEVDSFQDGILVSRSGERLKYDLAIVVPPHSPPKPVAESELGDESIWGYMRVDKVSLR
ncbi:MAG: FAD/NAD(P)-binding oxidoreductase, partial [Acidilobaceae archaeon]